MFDPIIRVRNVSFRYEDAESPAVDNVSMEVGRGEFLAVLGRNGSGKSTLAKLFNALLLPSSGSVEVDGLVAHGEDDCLPVRQVCGMVFQNPDNQIVSNVVEEDVAFAPENLGVAPPEIRARVDDALRQVGMYEFREHAPHLLSGGQKQRIAIAGVIAMRPKCIVLDEPTAMLDPQGRREVLSTISALCREHGITVVLITHHMTEAALADRVVVMAEGRIIADGTPREVFSQPERLAAVGLCAPQTVELLYALDQAGCGLPLDALSVEECADAIYRCFSR